MDICGCWLSTAVKLLSSSLHDCNVMPNIAANSHSGARLGIVLIKFFMP